MQDQFDKVIGRPGMAEGDGDQTEVFGDCVPAPAALTQAPGGLSLEAGLHGCGTGLQGSAPDEAPVPQTASPRNGPGIPSVCAGCYRAKALIPEKGH